MQREILDELARMIPGFSFDVSPPELTRDMYRMIIEKTGNADPFKEIKEKSNERAMALYEKVKAKVATGDSIAAAVDLAIAGNIIDYGLKKSLDINEALRKVTGDEGAAYSQEKKAIFHYREFESALENAGTVLYLGDNAGEVVFDRVLIEEIKRRYPDKRVIYAVKERPVINDALMEDALSCGLDDVVEVISSGSDAPGTILSKCSREFVKLFEESDMIISKGQGNYETLSEEEGPLFFLFMAKCEVVVRHLGCRLGDVILLDHSAWRRDT
jgi:uncharacterized protein with ATP-grasp and redox domains